MTDEQIGRAVFHAMWDRHVSQREVAAALGLTDGAISRKLRGGRPFSATELVTVAGLLRLGVDELLGRVPVPTDPLPRMDSNHQPAGVAHVVSLFGLRRPRGIPWPAAG